MTLVMADRGQLTRLSSFGGAVESVVIGASGGIGGAFVEALAGDPAVARVFALSRSGRVLIHDKVVPGTLDLEDEASIAEAAHRAGETAGGLQLVIVASGMLHEGQSLQPEKTWRSLSAASLERSFAINTIGPTLVAKHFLPLLDRDRKSVFAALSARVGSISDNELGGWYGYRASKAALNMLIRTLSIELQRRRPESLCIGLHPGTVDTGLSKPFQSGVREGRLFTPDYAAERLLAVIDGLGLGESGKVFAWDGKVIPF